MKKMLSVLLASAMAISAVGSLAACGGGGGDSKKTITVWAPSASHKVYQELAAEFTSTYQDGKYKDYKITFVAKEETTVRDDLATNPAGGADLYFFEGGQLVDMVKNNLLQPLAGNYASYATDVKARDEKTWVDLATSNNNVYAFPATADNTWFMWYDSEYFTNADDLKSLDAMVVKAKADNKQIMFKYNDGWYLTSFFFGAGCTIDYDEEGNYKNDFGGANGKKAVKALLDYLAPANNLCKDGKTKCIVTPANNDSIPQGMKKDTVVAGFMGTWIESAMPSKAKAMRTPTITIDGQQKPMRTFQTAKYCGVNPRRDNKDVAMALADFLTNEKGQAKRFEGTGSVPTNTNTAATDAVKNSAMAAVIAAQSTDSYPQLKHPSDMYKKLEAFGNNIVSGVINADNYGAQAEKLQADIIATAATT